MTLLRHARIANMARALEQRTIWPDGWSFIRCRSSSRSAVAGGASAVVVNTQG